MKNKLPYILLLVILCVGFCLLVANSRHTSKCPDDYTNDAAGSAQYEADITKWTNDYYDAHPGASLAAWAEARHQFWVDNRCTAALQRYDDAKAGKADPATMERIQSGIQGAVGTTP